MRFNDHSELTGKHAFLSPSKYHWIRYDEDKLVNSFRTALAAAKGTEIHDLAASLIKNGVKLVNNRKTLNAYVNDAIGYKMSPEVPLFVSWNAFGTVDAMSFHKNLLRIHDLKTGVNPAHMEQLRVYAAFFCLEYGIHPKDIEIELRIYQNDDILVEVPEMHAIFQIMQTVISHDKVLDELRLEVLS